MMEKLAEKESEASEYDQIFQSFTNRGPNKRKIKPVETQLIQFAFGDSDSEDDEDFEIAEDEHDADSEASDVSHTLEESRNTEASSDSDQDSVSSEDKVQVPIPVVVHSKKVTTVDDILSSVQNNTSNEQKEEIVNKETPKENVSSSKKQAVTISICGICLESESTEEDEVVACDGCGITVHEGCYGDIDDMDDDKSDSDAPTEPWFCDACKANVNPPCELCPVKGGIFKQTDTGLWVHLICALYTPAVGFRDVDKLQTIVLEDVPHSKWGLKQCMLCEDDQYSKTGICIDCDAGLCKTFFHVTCAQRNGLLSECPNTGEADEDMADPLYAHCKLHTDKRTMKKRIWSYLAFQSCVKEFVLPEDPDERDRIQTALQNAKKEYRDFRNKLAPPKILTEKAPRLLSTCPEACEQLLKKAELLGYVTDAHYDTIANKKQLNFHPNLSVEFVSHFYNREKWLKEADVTQINLQGSIGKLESELQIIKDACSDNPEQKKIKAQKETLSIEIRNMHSALELIIGKKLSIPSILKPNKPQTQDTSQKLMDTIFRICATCEKTDDQHLIVECDTCHKYYHLACVDPPLTHMPKKSAKYIWQCTECDESEEEEEEVDEIVESDGENQTLRKRPQRTPIAPKKFTPSKSPEEENGENKKSKQGRKRKAEDKNDASYVKKKKVSQNEVQIIITPGSNENKKLGRPRSDSRTKVNKGKIEIKCCVCKVSESSTIMVKCDECLKYYHFQCLDPPVKSSPKKKGYSWICIECDDTTDGDDSGDNSEKADDNTEQKEINSETK